MNRFLLAEKMNPGDELVWQKQFPDRRRFQCSWRINRNPEYNKMITITVIDMSTGNVKAVYSRHLMDGE